MPTESFHVSKADLSTTRLVSSDTAEPDEEEILVSVRRFGLTTNNITYAVFGDALGYWSYFPVDAQWGSVPVWGFGEVVASNVPGIEAGERLFGYYPMASEVLLRPAEISELCFSDAMPHRTGLHPWYNRYYRCAADPLYSEATAEVQPVLWALLMTGWMLADQLASEVDAVVISSASSKTALSLAWSLQKLNPQIRSIGLTSEGNRSFVESTGVYTDVQTYGSLEVDEGLRKIAFVDIAGNAQVASAVHTALEGRLLRSVTLGATHRAVAAEPFPMPGPAPALFFIPDVAEAQAANDGFESYHRSFAAIWQSFAPWAEGWLQLESGQGAAAIEAGYQAALAGGLPPQQAQVFEW